MTEERTCGTCRFFRRGIVQVPDPAWTAPPSAGWAPTVERPAETGQCRAEAPRPVGVAVDRAGLGIWPMVREGDWCGRYSAVVALEVQKAPAGGAS